MCSFPGINKVLPAHRHIDLQLKKQTVSNGHLSRMTDSQSALSECLSLEDNTDQSNTRRGWFERNN